MTRCRCPWCPKEAAPGYVSVFEGAPTCEQHGVFQSAEPMPIDSLDLRLAKALAHHDDDDFNDPDLDGGHHEPHPA